MIYFIALRHRNGDQDVDALWHRLDDDGHFISHFTANSGLSGDLFDLGDRDIYDYEDHRSIHTYPIGEADIQGLQLLPEEGEGGDDDDPFEEDEDDDDEDVDPADYIHPVIPSELPTAVTPDVAVLRVAPEGEEPIVAGRYTVRKERWAGFGPDGQSNYETFKPALVEFAKVIERNVTVDVPHGMHSALHDGERFWVNIWSSPDRNTLRNAEVPPVLFNHQVMCTDLAFVPTYHEMLLDTLCEGEYAVAQLFENDLYILHDAIHWGHENEVALLKHILAWAADAYDITPEERQRRIEERRREVALRNRNTYIEWVKGRDETRLNEAKRMLDQAVRNAENARLALVRAIAQQHEWQQNLDVAQRARPDPARFGREYDKLLDHPDITSVEFNPNSGMFTIGTRNIYAYSQKHETWHDIGEFNIQVGQQGEIKFLNLTRRVDGLRERMNHPHVWNSGEACLGNFAEIAATLVSQREYGTLFTMAIEFLKTANEADSAGQFLYRWPEVPEHVAQRREPEPEEVAVAEAEMVEVAE